MKSKTFLVSVMAIFVIAFALTSVSAAGIVDITNVDVNGVSASSNPIAGFVSDTVSVKVEFTANANLPDARVKVYIEGYKNEISQSTPRFRLVNGSRYTKRFTLKLPSSFDLDNDPEGLSLIVRVSAKGKDSVEKSYAIEMQKNSYSLQFLSVEAPQTITAGETIALDVVVENNGHERLDNVYVRASIPELGVQKKVYFGDLEATVDASDDSINDAVNKRIYLSIPRNAVPGSYDIKLEAYNYDTGVSVKKTITVSGIESKVLPATTTKNLAIGDETIYNLLIVNPSDRMVVYTITPEVTKGFIVDILEPVVTVPADSSRTVKIRVKATKSADEGTHLLTVNVNSEDGTTKQASFTANVENKAKQKTSVDNVFVLTVVLVVIFVVLLIVLIVLLTKKPTETEDFGETSYY